MSVSVIPIQSRGHRLSDGAYDPNCFLTESDRRFLRALTGHAHRPGGATSSLAHEIARDRIAGPLASGQDLTADYLDLLLERHSHDPGSDYLRMLRHARQELMAHS